MRALLLTGALTALLVVAGCGGDESAVCESLGDLQESVTELRDVEPGEGAVDELRESADDIDAEVTALQDAAGEELGDEAAALEDSARSLVADVEAAVAPGEVTRESLRGLADSLSRTVAAFDAFREAAPECDL